MNNFPDVMKSAKEDLAGSLPIGFTERDWLEILKRAESRLEEELPKHSGRADQAWKAVVLAFHSENFWGFTPGRDQKVRVKRKASSNLGVKFIWMAFQTFVLTKIAVVWIGQTYARSQEPRDFWLLCLVITLVVGNFAYFVWKHRNYPD